MEVVELLTARRIVEAIELVSDSFDNVHGKNHFEDGWVEKEIRAQFSKGPYLPKYYCVIKDGELIAIAGYAKSLFADNTYELRLAATSVNHMKKGYLNKLLLYRIGKIEEELNGKKGLIIMDTYMPDIYYKYGFELIKQSDDFNIMIKEVNS